MITIIIEEPLRAALRGQLPDEGIVLKKSSIKNTDIFTFMGVKITAQELVGVNAKYNRIQCGICGDTLESIYDHHSVFCSCGNCKIDGGSRELIRDCKGPYVELSKFY